MNVRPPSPIYQPTAVLKAVAAPELSSSKAKAVQPSFLTPKFLSSNKSVAAFEISSSRAVQHFHHHQLVNSMLHLKLLPP